DGVDVLVDRAPVGVDRPELLVDGEARAPERLGVERAGRESVTGRDARNREVEHRLANGAVQLELQPARRDAARSEHERRRPGGAPGRPGPPPPAASPPPCPASPRPRTPPTISRPPVRLSAPVSSR